MPMYMEVSMQFGYFDDQKREYVITDPRTPMPWANYLGSPAYGAIVTTDDGYALVGGSDSIAFPIYGNGFHTIIGKAIGGGEVLHLGLGDNQ